MSERYQVVIMAGGKRYHFKTETRVGSFQSFAEEMKTHVDWEQLAAAMHILGRDEKESSQ